MLTCGEVVLDPIRNPKRGDIVLQCLGDVFILVEIIRGKWYGDYNRICNYWYWYNLETKQIESGYGNFYKAVIK